MTIWKQFKKIFQNLKNIKPTKLLKIISNHYQFNYQFCNAGKDNEKSHVKIAVNLVRQASFNLAAYNSRKNFNSLKDVNKHLDRITNLLNKRTYNGKIINNIFKKELSYMVKPTKINYIHYIHDTRKVDKYSTIKFAKKITIPLFFYQKMLGRKM